MATSDKMDVVADASFPSNEIFHKEKKELVICLFTRRESLRAYENVVTVEKKNMCLHCVLHHRATLDWLSFISSFQQVCPLICCFFNNYENRCAKFASGLLKNI
jgi:hypothetical protein